MTSHGSHIRHCFGSEDSTGDKRGRRSSNSGDLPTLLRESWTDDSNDVTVLRHVLPRALSKECDIEGEAAESIHTQDELATIKSESRDGDSKLSKPAHSRLWLLLLPISGLCKLFCDCLASFAMHLALLIHIVRDWWMATSASSYLGCVDSRRQHWWCTIPPLLMGSGIFNHVFFSDSSRGITDYAAEIIAHSVLLVLSYLLSVTIHRRNLLPDVMLVSALLMSTFLPILFSRGDDLTARIECQIPVLPVIFLAPLFCSAGVHALVVCFGSFIAVTAYTAMVPASSRLIFLALSLALNCTLAIVAGLLEHYAARALRLQLANKKIIENCSDGFFTLNLLSGIVVETCPGAESHFGEMKECIFSQVLPRCTDKKIFDDLLAAAADGDFRSAVVTCRPKQIDHRPVGWPMCSSEFEAKIMPFSCYGGEVMLCFQVQGKCNTFDTDFQSEGSIASDAITFDNNASIDRKQSSRKHGTGSLPADFGYSRPSEQILLSDLSTRLTRRRSSEQMSTLSELSISEENAAHSLSLMTKLLMKPSSRRSSHSMVSMWTSSRRTSVSGDFVLPTSRRSSRSSGGCIGGGTPSVSSTNLQLPSLCGKRSQQVTVTHRSPKKEGTGFRIPFRGSITNLRGSSSSQASTSPLSFSESESESFVSLSPRKSILPSISVLSCGDSSSSLGYSCVEADSIMDPRTSVVSNTPSTHSSDGKSLPPTRPLPRKENENEICLADAVVPFDSVIASSPSTVSGNSGESNNPSELKRLLPRVEAAKTQCGRMVDSYSQTDESLIQSMQSARPPLAPILANDSVTPVRPRQNSTKASSLRGLLKRSRSSSQSSSSMDSPLQLPMFSGTPMRSKQFSAELVLSCWNNHCGESICCSWHAGINALKDVADMLAQTCRKEWLPFHGVQCQECQCLVEEDEPYCLMCSAPVFTQEFESRRSSLLSDNSRQSMSPMPRYPLSPGLYQKAGSESSSSKASDEHK